MASGNISFRLLAAATAILAATGCGQSAPPAAAWQITAQVADFPARPNSAEPQLTVRGDKAVLSWVESDPRALPPMSVLKFAERGPTGWSMPKDVASGENWFVNSADLPSVLRLSDSTLAAHWLEVNSEDNDEAYDVRLAFSKDNGTTWSAPVSPHHDGTKTQHGFVTLFGMPDAGLGAVWLDGRNMPSEDEGSMGLRAATFDATGKQLTDALLDDKVCECCATAVATTAEGPIVAFRDRSDGEIRDIYVSRLSGGTWTPPALVHADGWKITACPINGPAIDASGQHVAVTWFTAPMGDGHSFIAFSSDAGKTFGTPVRLDDAKSTGRVAVTMLADGSAVASWIEFANDKSQLMLRRVTPAGEKSAAQAVAPLSQTSGFPRMVRRGDELVAAWTESDKGALRVKTATAALPK